MKLGRIIDVTEGVELGGTELHQRVISRAREFAARGLGHGDRAIVCHRNSLRFFVDLLGLWQCGVCVAPLDPATTTPELLNISGHCRAKAIVVRPDQTTASTDSGSWTGVELFESDGSPPASRAEVGPSAGLGMEDDALILYTSGSTGEPKGVVHTLRSVLARTTLLRSFVPLEQLRRTANLLPTHFGHGLICNCLYPLLNGCDLVLLPAQDPATLLSLGDILDDFGVTFMSSVPAVWEVVTRGVQPPKRRTLERVHCGSSPLGEDLHHRIREWTTADDVRNVYGITEAGSWLAGPLRGDQPYQAGHVGVGWGTDIAILPDGENPSLLSPGSGPTTEGMVWVRTPALARGYLERPELTDAVFRHGWFETGDVGQLDDQGQLELVGRKKNEINKAGMKIYPEDIDLAIKKHENVVDACAFAYDDPVSGQDVGIAFVLEHSNACSSEELTRWLGEQLSVHKLPSQWYEVASLPRTASGKLNRDVVRHAVMTGVHG